MSVSRRLFGAFLLTSSLLGCAGQQRPDGGRGFLSEGALAPDVSAVDQNGVTHALLQERGHPVVVYFYPKDATPGCTKEACAFRDVWKKYEQAGVSVFGVSADDQQSHADFAREHRLTFPLLADTENRWASAFGVSSTFGFYARVTFLIGPDGTIARIYRDVDPGVHAEQVLADAQALTR